MASKLEISHHRSWFLSLEQAHHCTGTKYHMLLGMSSTSRKKTNPLEEVNQRLWLAFMSCCLARSDDKREGRDGVGDLSRQGSDKID